MTKFPTGFRRFTPARARVMHWYRAGGADFHTSELRGSKRAGWRGRTALVLACTFLLSQLAACFSERTDATGPLPEGACDVPTSALGPGKAVIAIYQYAFYPDTLRVSAGTTITWVNCDSVAGTDAHTATSDTGVWASPLFAVNQVYARVFGQAGTFPYHCVPHPSMRAVVIVQ